MTFTRNLRRNYSLVFWVSFWYDSTRRGIDLGTALMAKVLDTVEDAGAALEEMIETAVIPGLGENIDIRV